MSEGPASNEKRRSQSGSKRKGIAVSLVRDSEQRCSSFNLGVSESSIRPIQELPLVLNSQGKHESGALFHSRAGNKISFTYGAHPSDEVHKKDSRVLKECTDKIGVNQNGNPQFNLLPRSGLNSKQVNQSASVDFWTLNGNGRQSELQVITKITAMNDERGKQSLSTVNGGQVRVIKEFSVIKEPTRHEHSAEIDPKIETVSSANKESSKSANQSAKKSQNRTIKKAEQRTKNSEALGDIEKLRLAERKLEEIITLCE